MKAWQITTLMLGMVLMLSQCRSRTKPTEVEGPSVKVYIKLENLEDRDKNQKDYVYVLEGCSDVQLVPGTLDEDDIVTFSLKGISVGDTCNLRIQDPNADAVALGFRSDKNLLYSANSVKVLKDLKQRLVGTAFLQRQYYQQGKLRYTLEAKVSFPEALGNKINFEGELDCDPQLYIVSESLEKTDEKSGVFTFSAVFLDEGENKHQCTNLYVFEDGKRRFKGALGDNGTSIVGQPGATITVTDGTIALQKVDNDTTNGEVIVTTDDPSACKEGEIFNTKTRQCEKTQ